MLNSFQTKLKIIFLLFFSFLSSFFIFRANSVSEGLIPAEGYPRWLMNSSYSTLQTSGITFIDESEAGVQQFLLADDIGKIHRFFISEDTVFKFSEIKFGEQAISFLSTFPKQDFEEIFFDRHTGEVYISIEGNEENFLLYHGIFKCKFLNDDFTQDSIVGFEKLEFQPKELFESNLRWNVGYEGFTADENYFYLGLENIQTSEGQFTDSTIIRIADKFTLDIVKEISTNGLGLSTICGLYSNENFSLWGIDRNEKKVFKLNFDEYFNVIEKQIFDIKTVVPGYNNFEYVGSLESITFVSENTIFLVDDPWHTYFIPPDEILNQLDNSTVNNFRNFIPVIYKFIID